MKKRKGVGSYTDKDTRLTFVNDGIKRHEKGRQIQKRDTTEYQQLVDRVYEHIREGMRSNEIFATLLVEDDTLTDVKFSQILKDAYELAEVSLQKDREYTFQLHMERYEKMYEEAIKMTNSWGQPLDPKKDWAVINARYIAALKQLEAKERLIGLHDKSLILELTEQRATVLEKEETRSGHILGYDLDKLTLEEQIELLQYIKDCRTVPVEGIQRVVIKKTVIEINTDTGERNVNYVSKNINEVNKVKIQDIEFEEMPDNVIDKFQAIEDVKEEEEIDNGSIHVEDLTNGLLEGEQKQGEDVVKSVQLNAVEQLKKKLKESKIGKKE